ncbi:MAG: glycosyltransferase family 2 protein, partial [Lachnospiraceae bacterium]|nr:glycosyltransferase family 2 protein [Lachnospiraceae bacterium]
KCFESLVNQTIGIENMEIIFVNDASTDNTGEKLNSFEALYPDSVLVIHLDENVKQGGARNVALQYVSGEYLVFIDSDDWVDLTYLETVYNIVKENDVDMLQIPFVHVRGEGENATYTKTPAYWEGLYVMEDTNARKHFLTHQLFNCGAPNKIYRTEMVRKANACFLQGVAYEEPSFVYPLFFYANRIYQLDAKMYFYRLHETSTMTSYITKPGKLYDHPFVQLSVYKQIRSNPEFYSVYKDEIDYYFLFTFYIETLYFSKMGNLYLGYDFFLLMQNTVRNMVPDWAENSYIQTLLSEPMIEALASVACKLSEEEFLEFKKNLQ